ncbi:MAG: lipid-A-disaccharide synthase [Holosporaceae bacterium]|jgi:lipid-A-disaccharide synthase|nr:lipid-A-disaccharide synthase [Holosporaceae bacterium]
MQVGRSVFRKEIRDVAMICIVCGGGNYPRLVARACVEKELGFCLLFLNGLCGSENWPDVPCATISFGEIQKAIDFLKQHAVKKIVFAGKVERPNFDQIFLDKKARYWLLQLGKAICSGDDALLRGVADLIQREGFEVISGTDLLSDVFLATGIFSKRKPSRADCKSIDIGIAAAKELGLSDEGQSVVVCGKEVVGKEDSAGTNALLERCGAELKKRGGILVKISKPQQDDRFDLPTIGVETIEMLHSNGFHGVALEANKCLVIHREEVIKRANELHIFIEAINVFVTKIFMVAGEASGDYLGGKLMEDISSTLKNNKIEFFGVGGACMEKAGLRKLFSIEKLSIIGIFEVIGKLFRVKKLINKTVKAVLSYRPDVIVTIDSSGFTHRVAKKVKKEGCKIPIVHYVAPPVWAWRGWRAKSMPNFLDKLMVLFPAEPAYFEKHGLKTVFVGHPVASDPDFCRPDSAKLEEFQKSIFKDGDKKKSLLITLLPGSRLSEINYHLPVLEKFAELMIKKHKNVQFIIPTIEYLQQKIGAVTKSWSQKPIIVTDKSQKNLAYYSSDIAVAASGTVTIELARVGLPFVAIYKTSRITYWIVKFLIKVENVCLVNLLSKKRVIPELLQDDCTPKNIFDCVEKLLRPEKSQEQRKCFEKVISLISRDSKQAAVEVLDFIPISHQGWTYKKISDLPR